MKAARAALCLALLGCVHRLATPTPPAPRAEHTGFADAAGAAFATPVIYRGALVIDGTGATPQVRDLVVRGDRIIAVSPAGSTTDGSVIDVTGKFIMPMLVDLHTHVGLLEGTTTATAHYTPENVARQLDRYSAYGVQAVLALGSDRPGVQALREALHDSHGAFFYTAGRGIGVPNGLPPIDMGFDQALRPSTADQAREAVKQVALEQPSVVKIWVDDFWGKFPTMKPEIYTAVIAEAHAQGLRVAAHVYHLSDARKLVDAGVDILAHSIRDAPVDATFIDAMKQHNVVYLPTLSIDEFAFAYGEEPTWLTDDFFLEACEEGVADMVQSSVYRHKVRSNPVTAIERTAFTTASANVKRLFDAGVTIGLGTDSGASPIRVQGFSEHHELSSLVAAGLTPLQAITIGTGTSATILGIANDTGTLEPGKAASFMILGANPLERIHNTHAIEVIYFRGRPTMKVD